MSDQTPAPQQIRKLNITDLERIERFRIAGYGGAIADVLLRLGVHNTLLSLRFRPLRQGMQLVGRALPIKGHSLVFAELPPAERAAIEAKWQAEGHPQERMMRAIAEAEDGVILCYDCGGDTRIGHCGEMTCQLAYAQGSRGMLMAGNLRDTQYIIQMADFPVFSFGACPFTDSDWIITEVNQPIYLPGHLSHYVRVMPGDFLFGDNDGVQLIPADVADEVLLQVEAVYAHENKVRAALTSGMPVEQVYRVFGVL
ncbi:MAG: RraA family protein [Chloroflexi bacterium]|nr:RraA family protein [Chloroflexota bacterium]